MTPSRTRAALTVTALSLSILLAACGGGSDSDDGGSASDGGSGGGGGDLSITMLPKNLGNAYFDTSTDGAEKAATEIGAEFE
ncbi:MAG: hypothetical protein ABW188_17725, partial [Rhodococcus fascians]